MRITVTGGNGYVGRELSRLLLKSHDVVVIDTLRYGENRFSAEDLRNLDFRKIDILDADAVKATIDEVQPDVIVHLAAIHYIPECEEIPGLATATNLTGLVNILHACPVTCRFVFASSAAVYAPEDCAHVEDISPLAPMDVYGITKLSGEHFLKNFARKAGFPAVAVRLFNVIGAGETNPHVMPEIVAQLKAGRTSIKLGNLKPQRDYIDVRDVANGFAAAALNGEIEPGTVMTVNLGMGKAHSVEHLVQMIRDCSGIGIRIEIDPSRVREVDRPLLLADNSRMRVVFDWEPKEDLKDTLARMWEEPDLPHSLSAKYLP